MHGDSIKFISSMQKYISHKGVQQIFRKKYLVPGLMMKDFYHIIDHDKISTFVISDRSFDFDNLLMLGIYISKFLLL